MNLDLNEAIWLGKLFQDVSLEDFMTLLKQEDTHIVVLQSASVGKDVDLSKIASLGQVTMYEDTKPSEIKGRILGADIVITNKNEMTKGSIPHDAPGYFFEMSADWWRYGLFYGDNPKVMENFRARINADPAGCERMLKLADRQNIYNLEGEDYKRIFNKDLDPYLNKWAQKKWITYVRYENYDNMDFYSPKLVDTVFEGFKKIYPVYKYFKLGC